MTANKSTEGGELDLSKVAPQSRKEHAQAFDERAQAERDALQRPDGRRLRRKGRTENLSLKVKPEDLATLHRIAAAEDITMTEVIVRAIAMYDKALRGK